jgi:uncharacterized protein YoxC
MKNSQFSFTLLCSSMLGLSACGPMNQMTEMRDATVQMPGIMQKMQTTMDGMNQTMKGMDQNMTDMRGDMKGMSTQMSSVDQNMTDMHGDMKSMATDVKAMSGQMSSVNENMTGLRGDMKEMGTDVKTMAGKMDAVNENMTGLHGDMKSMTTDVKGMAGQMTSVNENMMGLRGDMKGMAVDVKTMAGQMGGLNQSINTMAGKMDSMNDSVLIMANQMSGLSGDIKNMSEVLNLTHSDLRLIFTGQHRLEALAAMEASEGQVTKLGYAGEYMISHTYQSWNSKVDEPSVRLDLMGLAVPDFFYKVSNYIADRERVNPTLQDQQSMNLFAIASSLDYVNSIELDGLNDSKAPVVTMLSMIEEGLLAKADVNSGKIKLDDLPTYQREVLNREQDAIYLLRIRHNFLKAVAYSLSESSISGDEPSKLKSIWNVFKARVLGKTISHQVNELNVAQIEVIATVLDLAYATEKFLVDLGVDPMNNKNVEALLKKMRNVPNVMKGSGAEIEHFNESLDRVSGRMN